MIIKLNLMLVLMVQNQQNLSSMDFNRIEIVKSSIKLKMLTWRSSIIILLVCMLYIYLISLKKLWFKIFDIAVDWNILAASLNYMEAQRSTKHVGHKVAMVIIYMVTTNKVKLENIHIIGHSLGAHAAGYSGVLTQSVGKVARITGLDPALPGKKL